MAFSSEESSFFHVSRYNLPVGRSDLNHNINLSLNLGLRGQISKLYHFQGAFNCASFDYITLTAGAYCVFALVLKSSDLTLSADHLIS